MALTAKLFVVALTAAYATVACAFVPPGLTLRPNRPRCIRPFAISAFSRSFVVVQAGGQGGGGGPPPPQATEQDKSVKLLLSILIDVVGLATFAIPGAGEAVGSKIVGRRYRPNS